MKARSERGPARQLRGRRGIARRVWYAATFAAAILASSSARATTITLSDASSDATPASSLDATFVFNVLAFDTLELVVTNDTTAPHEFDINAVYWNASDDVTGLTLLAAFDTNTLQDHFASWNPIQTDIMADGFGNFEFGLTDGLGENDPNSIMPGDSITFVMAIDGPCADALNCDMTDFFAANPKGYVAAAKFASGPNDPEAPGTQDSAWGAAIPEPGSAGLLGLGLAALFIGRRLRG
jgi:hypothetical protein